MLFPILAAVGLVLPAADISAAMDHRATLPPEDIPYVYYLTTSHLSPEDRERCETAMRLVLPSLTLETVVDHQVPQPVNDDGLFWIDTRGFGWGNRFYKVLESYPYSHAEIPLVIRADWFLVEATDCAESETYYDLVFGERLPNRDDFVKRLKIDRDPQYAFGLIEGKSGVAVAKKRWVESLGVPRGYAWATRDLAKVDKQSDPINFPDGSFQHDAEEWIVGVPKLHAASGTRGALQVYFVSNGDGVTQDKAPGDIATDHTGVRYGAREVRNGISCIACHSGGINKPTVNEFRGLIESGVDVYAKKDQQAQLEAFHLGDIDTEIARNNEDFAAIVSVVCGCEPEEAVGDFVASVKRYDADVTLESAAMEFGLSADELKLALAYASNEGYPARLAALAHGTPMPRTVWEEYYLLAYAAVKNWSKQ